jgi:2-polyprenyl-6-methoxyphenol hydroxylase-like FAD-dependent oxidoreductase
MQTLGLLPAIVALGQPLDRLVGHDARSGRTVLDMRYAKRKGLGRGLGVHRAALFGVLHEAVLAEGIELVTGRTVTGCQDGQVLCGATREGPFDLVVDALGAASPLRQALPQAGASRPLAFGAIWGTVPWVDTGFERTALMQRYERASVMIGVLPV